ncbi:MAG: 4'-phosphopantetheinyl transferase superfamily protein [Kastovskya adunca ATA6-11-RM4]|nr:4'-phosphopantetheinyl transferase superfamily protein [Kastovskya adunca ATA6-11-RM4]
MTASNDTWLSPTADLSLLKDEVHIWRAELNLPEWRLQHLAQLLSPDEQQRAERFYFEQHRQRFIAARGILRTLLGRYLAIEPHQLQFRYQPRGKPVLVESCGGKQLFFNLSHSNDLALYAVTLERQVGIDLEYLRPISDAEQLAKRFFSAGEYEAIRALSPSQKQEAFFRYWTCKEACIKATGEGLAQLDKVEISLTPEAPANLLNSPSPLQNDQDWVLLELTPASNYVAAVAVVGKGWQLSRWQFL